MMYIKLDEDMNLVITENAAIYRGDNMNQKITYLIPETVGDIDMLAATLYLCYVRADSVADIVCLERAEGKYNDKYYQYVLPVTCRMSKCAGRVCSWLSIMSGNAENPVISKSGECTLYIEESKNLDDYICDHQLSAIYALQKQSGSTEVSLEVIEETLHQKGDSLTYDPDTKLLYLVSNGEMIGKPVSMEAVSEDDGAIYYNATTPVEKAEPQESQETASDDVIYFN